MTDADIGVGGVGGVSADENEKRRSQDKCTNQFGKIQLDFCTTFQGIPLNGNHSGDSDGHLTLVSHQGNSVIDYVLVSVDFIYKTWMHFEIGSRVESSHMPLHLSITKKQTQEQKQKLNSTRENTTRIKWNSENDTNETFVPELDNPITEHEDRQAIKNLKTGKVCGLDDIWASS